MKKPGDSKRIFSNIPGGGYITPCNFTQFMPALS